MFFWWAEGFFRNSHLAWVRSFNHFCRLPFRIFGHFGWPITPSFFCTFFLAFLKACSDSITSQVCTVKSLRKLHTKTGIWRTFRARIISSWLSELFATEDRACARYIRGLWKRCRCSPTECTRTFHFSFRKRSGKSELFFYPRPKYSWSEWTTSSADVRLTRHEQGVSARPQAALRKSLMIQHGLVQKKKKQANFVNTVDSISYVLFLFEKIKSPVCPILFKFSGELCYGLIYSPLYEWDP